MALKRGVRAGQIGNAVKLPIVGHALENVCAEIFERDAGARYNILDGTRDEDVVGASKTRYTRCDVHCDAPDVVPRDFDLASVMPARIGIPRGRSAVMIDCAQ